MLMSIVNEISEQLNGLEEDQDECSPTNDHPGTVDVNFVNYRDSDESSDDEYEDCEDS